MSKIEWHDAWIKANYDGEHMTELCRRYNRTFETDINRTTFRFHMKSMGLVSEGRYYTDTQRDFLKKTYPAFGAKRTAELFENRFGKKVDPASLKAYCRRRLNVSVPREVRYGSLTSPIGTVSENCRGEVMIKTENGWIKATHSQVDVPAGMVAFNLDGDRFNNSPENIGITTNSKFRTLRNNGFWSEDRELTKTGLIWCDLNELLKQ